MTKASHTAQTAAGRRCCSFGGALEESPNWSSRALAATGALWFRRVAAEGAEVDSNVSVAFRDPAAAASQGAALLDQGHALPPNLPGGRRENSNTHGSRRGTDARGQPLSGGSATSQEEPCRPSPAPDRSRRRRIPPLTRAYTGGRLRLPSASPGAVGGGA